ncbi:hypothetical protein L1049_008825 [Liquidambar formosana]|uniref:Uncharacterized protein n=1 Tax=Liquidambar formosana TaxID=63359 RepID=A0AAP0S4W2_LIQFO
MNLMLPVFVKLPKGKITHRPAVLVYISVASIQDFVYFANMNMAEEAEINLGNRRWSLKGMTALVTGGTRGIGHAIVEELARFGAVVHTCSRNQTELNECLLEWKRKGLRVTGSVCDLTSRAEREKLMETVSSAFHGKLNILVNNAGVAIVKETTEFTADDFSTIMGTNFESGYHLCQLAHPIVKASGNGSIVFISSIASVKALPLCSIYSATKGALNQLTRNLAYPTAKEVVDRIVSQTPIHRPGETNEVSSLVAFLCFPAASYITGQVFANLAKISMAECEINLGGGRWSLKGMTALVTGGTRGIGHAIVEELARFGAIVHTCSRNQTELNQRLLDWESKGLTVTASVCDLLSRAQREKLMDTVSSVFHGKLNILVNNAGVTTVPKETTEFTAEDFSAIMGTNFESAYHLCQLAHPLLKSSGNGSIVFISSVGGVKAFPLCSIYSASKAAMNQLTKNLACEWAKDNIRANSVAPGVTRTSLLDNVEQDPKGMEVVSRLVSQNPIGRIGEPNEVSSLVAFLCFPAASYITGQLRWVSKMIQHTVPGLSKENDGNLCIQVKVLLASQDLWDIVRKGLCETYLTTRR